MMRNRNIKSFTHGLEAKFDSDIDWSCFHQHQNEIEFAFHPSGRVEYRFGGRVEAVESCETILYWGSIPHQAFSLPPDDVCYYLTVPVSLFVQMSLPHGFVHRVLSGEVIREADSLLRKVDLELFRYWKTADIQGSEELRKAFLHWVQFRILRFASNASALNPIAPAERSTAPATLEYVKIKKDNAIERMFEFITANFLREFAIDDVARVVGLNTNYANTVFCKHTGISIGRFVTMLRIYKAQSLLLTSDLKVIDIALESGFRSVGNFYKMFAAHVGENPSRYRSKHMPRLRA